MARRPRARTIVAVMAAVVVLGVPGSAVVVEPAAVALLGDGHGVRRLRRRPRARGGMAGMPGMAHGAASVADLTDPARAPPTSRSRSPRARQAFALASGERGRRLHAQRHARPGPTIQARRGRAGAGHAWSTTTVPDGVTLHWHGVDVPNAEDGVAGVTQDAVPVGRRATSTASSPTRPARYWYHSHQVSHEQVQRRAVRRARGRAPRRRAGRARRGRRSLHIYDGAPDGQRPDRRRPASTPRRGAARPGPRGQHRQRAAPRRGSRRARTGCWPSTATTCTARPRCAARPSRLAAGGRVDLEVTAPADGSGVRVGRRRRGGRRAGGARAPRRRRPASRSTCCTYGTPAAARLRPRHADRRFEYSHRPPPRLRRRQARAAGGRSTATCSPTCRCSWSREGDVVRMHIEQPQRRACTRCTCTATTRSCSSRDGVKATGSPWWVDSLDVAERRQLRHRVRRRQPGHLDGPLPQPAARRAGPGGAPDVRGRRPSPFRVGGDADNEPE